MASYEFWKDWKRRTKLEESAIKSLKIMRGLILSEIPRDQIVSIYAKGSFVRREMNEKSDVDSVTILRDSKSLRYLKKLEEKYREEYSPQLQFSGYSLWELKHNKRTGSGKELRASPSRTVQHLEHYELIYGEQLRKGDFNQGPEKGHLRGMYSVFTKTFLPEYEKKRFSFSEIAKQVFWLVENEQKWIGRNPPHSWGKLEKSILDKDHIIHDALRFRLEPTKDKREMAQFIRKLNKYLVHIEKLITQV